MNPKRWTAMVLLLVIASGFGIVDTAAAESRSSVLYPVENRIAAELVPLAETVLGDSGSASLDTRTNAILLVGPERDVEAALAILRAQDRPLRRIVVRQSWVRRERLQEAGLEVIWSATTGDVRVGSIPTPPRDNRLAVRGYADFLEAHSRNSSRIDVIEGSKARISSGTIVPLGVGPDADGSKSNALGVETTWVDVGRGFAVQARVLRNGHILVDLSSVESEPLADGRIPIASAQLQIELEPGEVRVVGGLERVSSGFDVERGSQRSRRSATSGRLLVLSVE